MYFVYRNGNYIDVAGSRFRDFMDGRLHNLAGTQATVGDFADHMTTVFTDVRLKRFLEMRGADAGTAGDDAGAVRAVGRPAVRRRGADRGRGAVARAAGWRMSRRCAPRCRARVWRQLPWRGGSLRDLARDVVAIAARRAARARRGSTPPGQDESAYLAPLEAIAAGAPTQAEHWLARFHGDWGGDVRQIFAEAAI